MNMQAMEKRWEESCSQERRKTLASQFLAMGYTRAKRHQMIEELIECKKHEKMELLEGLICSNRDGHGNYISKDGVTSDEFSKLFSKAIGSNNIPLVRKFIADYHDPKDGPIDEYFSLAVQVSEEMTKLLLDTDVDILKTRIIQHGICQYSDGQRGCNILIGKYNAEYKKRRDMQEKLEQEKQACILRQKEAEQDLLFAKLRMLDSEKEH